MRIRCIRRLVVVAVAWLPSVLIPGVVVAQAPAAPPPDAAETQVAELVRQLRQAETEFRAILTSPDVMLDPAKRDAAAPRVLPALNRMLEIVGKLEIADPAHAEEAVQMQMQLRLMAATFGDADARAALERTSATGSEADRPVAQAALLMVDWLRSNKDADVQGRLLNEAGALAKAHARNNTVTQIIAAMGDMAPANDEVRQRAVAIASGMDSDHAGMLKSRAQADARLKSIEGKPLTIRGTTVDGTPFSTDQWKGKVVLVDFWATWCGPCLAELPRVKKTYAEYHEQGLEVLGVSNDYRASDLKQFMEKNADMPWPQLIDEQAARNGEWHPITIGFGIDGIPTMFLIDRKGICRTVQARDEFEELIPKLLAESGE